MNIFQVEFVRSFQVFILIPKFIRIPARFAFNQEKPVEFVIGTCESRTVREFGTTAFGAVRLNAADHVRVDQRFVGPTDTGPLIAEGSKAKRVLGWSPKTPFAAMVEMMVQHHLWTPRGRCFRSERK